MNLPSPFFFCAYEGIGNTGRIYGLSIVKDIDHFSRFILGIDGPMREIPIEMDGIAFPKCKRVIVEGLFNLPFYHKDIFINFVHVSSLESLPWGDL